MMQDPLHIYQQRADAFRVTEKKHQQQLTWTSFVRLLLFLVFAWFVYQSFRNRMDRQDLLMAGLFFMLFLVLVFVAAGIKRKIKFVQQLVRINENEIALANGGLSFLSNGEGLQPKQGFSADLNVFGKYSLYHAINRTASQAGERQLVQLLAHPFTNSQSILDYQSCAKELAALISFRQTLLAHTLLLQEEDTVDALRKGIPIADFDVLQNRFWSMLSIAWPILGVGVVMNIFTSGNFGKAAAVTVVGLLLMALVLKKVNLLYYHISRRSYLYSQYAKCFALIGAQDFSHPYLRQRRDEIVNASKAFKSLARLTGVFDLRLSMLTLFLNGLFLSDLLCARAYLKWNEKYQDDISRWFDILGEMELLNSIATYHQNHPGFPFPQPTQQFVVHASSMGHPLMKESAAVVNDVQIGDNAKLLLITGSNMSGKSTFLRTLGLNMILAQIGAPVFAKTFVFHPLRLLTSFHHIDSLEESTSYFYAELKSLKNIIDSLSDPVPALVLLDEVMRGTNSKDKHDGSALLIKKLLNYPALSLIATHDIELGTLADQYTGQIKNFCFESVLDKNELHFDFKMRPGIAQAKNATFLMQQMGII